MVSPSFFPWKWTMGRFGQHGQIRKASTAKENLPRPKQPKLVVDKDAVSVVETLSNPRILASTSIPCHSNKSLANSAPDTLLSSECPRRFPPAVHLDQEPSSIKRHLPEPIDSLGSISLSNSANMNGYQSFNPAQQHPAPRPHLHPGPGPGPQSEILGLGIVVRAHTNHRTQPELSFAKEWSRIKRLRVEIWSTRSKIQEMRGILRDQQLSKAVADDNYFQFVRLRGHGLLFASYNTSEEQRTMETLLQACELARNEYGPFEDDCNLLESSLSVQEFELDRLERKFYDRPLEARAPPSDQYKSTFDSPSSSITSESEADQQSHPLVTKYQSKVGDVEILRERLDELLEERYTLEEEMEKRHRVNRELGEDDLLWLENYSVTERDLIEQFERTEKEAEELKQKCLAKDLVDEAGNPTNFEHRERRSFAADPDIFSGSETSEFIKFPILIPKPGSKQALVQLSGVEEEILWRESSARVDWWLLDQLRMSPMEVNLLERIYVSQFGPIDRREKWQFDVLDYWYVDGARTSRSGPHTSTGISLFTQAPVRREQPSSNIETASDEPGAKVTIEDLQRLRYSEIGSAQSSKVDQTSVAY